MSDDDDSIDEWKIITCPTCKGKKQFYVEYEEEFHSGYENCYDCNGKGEVKVNIAQEKEAFKKRLNELKEWRYY